MLVPNIVFVKGVDPDDTTSWRELAGFFSQFAPVEKVYVQGCLAARYMHACVRACVCVCACVSVCVSVCAC